MGELFIFLAREQIRYGLEQLHDMHARLDLHREVVRRDVRKQLQQRVAQRRLLLHQLSGVVRLSAGASAFDHKRRQRQRSAGEPDQRQRAVELAQHELDAHRDKRELVARIDSAQPVDVAAASNRRL